MTLTTESLDDFIMPGECSVPEMVRSVQKLRISLYPCAEWRVQTGWNVQMLRTPQFVQILLELIGCVQMDWCAEWRVQTG